MENYLLIKFRRDRNGAPLAVIRDLPGADAELTPAQLRALGVGLLEVAADCRHQEPGEGRGWLHYDLPEVAA